MQLPSSDLVSSGLSQLNITPQKRAPPVRGDSWPMIAWFTRCQFSQTEGGPAIFSGKGIIGYKYDERHTKIRKFDEMREEIEAMDFVWLSYKFATDQVQVECWRPQEVKKVWAIIQKYHSNIQDITTKEFGDCAEDALILALGRFHDFLTSICNFPATSLSAGWCLRRRLARTSATASRILARMRSRACSTETPLTGCVRRVSAGLQ